MYVNIRQKELADDSRVAFGGTGLLDVETIAGPILRPNLVVSLH